MTKARSKLSKSPVAKKQAKEEDVAGIEATIRKPMVVPYADPEQSSSNVKGHIELATIQRVCGTEREESLMRQLCTCDSCTGAAVESYKRLVNEGKVMGFRSFGDYWKNRCFSDGLESHTTDINDLLFFYDESRY